MSPIFVRPVAANASTPEIAEMIAALTNQARQSHGIHGLETSKRLSKAALRFSKILATQQKLSHTADGQNLTARAKASDYRFRTLGENIGWTSKGRVDQATATDLVHRWLGSRGHRANLLNARFKDIGVGVTRAGGRTYAVQIFGAKA